jgi:hypothetical protein
VYWQPKSLPQVLGEPLHLVRLGTFRAAHAQGQPNHDLPHHILANDPIQGREILPLVPALQGLQSLRCDAQGIGNGNPDPSGPHI